MSNPLVASPVDSTTTFSGAFLLDDADSLCTAIKSGDWASGIMSGVSLALDTAAAVMDPIGTLIANGVGWLIDHLQPIKGWFDQLTGDADQVAAFSATYANVAQRMQAVSASAITKLSDLDSLSGETITAYRAYLTKVAKQLHSSSEWASAISTGFSIASKIVQVVHNLTRDILSQLVGSVISAVIEAIATVGFGLPAIIAQLSTRVASMAARLSTTIKDLVAAIRDFRSLLRPLTELIERIKGGIEGLAAGGKGVAASVGSLLDPLVARVVDKASPAIDRLLGARREALQDNPLSEQQIEEILALPKGSRPDPASYLPSDYIADHLAGFDQGGTRFMNLASYQKYGIAQVDGTSFMMSSRDIDRIMAESGGDPRAMENALGLPQGFFGSDAVRVDVDGLADHGMRMPSGNEAGANDQWLPGGKLPGGLSEVVIDGAGVVPDRVTPVVFGAKEVP